MFAVSMCSSKLACFYHTVLEAEVWQGGREREWKGTSTFCVSWVLLLYSQLRRFKQTVFVFVHTKEGGSAGASACPNRHGSKAVSVRRGSFESMASFSAGEKTAVTAQ